MSGSAQAEDESKPVSNGLQIRRAELAGARTKKGAIERKEPRDVDDRGLAKAGLAFRKLHVAWGLRETKIRGDRSDDDGGDGAAVKGVGLNDEYGTRAAGA